MKLFYVAVAFIVLTIFTNLTKNEITPFYVWSMYSAKFPETDSFPIYTMHYNNGQEYSAPHTWKDHKRMMFFYPVEYYTTILDNKSEADAVKMGNAFNRLHLPASFLQRIYNTPQQLQNYPVWLKRYLEANEGIHIDTLTVSRQWIKFDNEGKAHSISTEPLFSI